MTDSAATKPRKRMPTLDERIARRALVAKVHTENPLLSYTDIAAATGEYKGTVWNDIQDIRAGYEVLHPGAIQAMRERHTGELETLIGKVTKNIDHLLANADPDEQMALAQQVGVVVKAYERLHKMHGVDVPKTVNLNAKLLRISIERGLPVDRVMRLARDLGQALLEEG